MVRTAVFAIVLSLSGPSAANVVCGLFCQQHTGSTAHHSHGQDEPSGSTSVRMTPAHACDHLTAVTPFLLQPLPNGPTLQVEAGVVPGVVSFASERSSDLINWLAPPGGGGAVLHSRSPILRI
jgi:hypothetical protein